MPGVTRVYTYRFAPPSDGLRLAVAIKTAGEYLMKYNKNVLKVDTVADGEHMLLRLTVHGHDQWQIKRKIVYPVVGIFTKVGIKISEVTLQSVEPLPHHQHTMEWKNDTDRLIEHDIELKPRKAKAEDWHVTRAREVHLQQRAATQ